jgi:hypothetical protein
MGKRYEVIWEIYNKCSGNQMRDVFFEEIETDDASAYISNRFQGYEITLTQNAPTGELIYDIEAEGLRQRMTLTEI